jgi:serine/threonine-protein kinase RsbW
VSVQEKPMESKIRVEIPASGAYLTVLRAAATGLAAGLRFTYEELDDLRIAVDEACAQVLARRDGAETLQVDYATDGSALQVQVALRGGSPGEPLPRDTFAWRILSALTDGVEEELDADCRLLRFRKVGGRH